MAQIGKINELKVIKTVDFGVYLDGEDLGEILLPQKYVADDLKINDSINVFIYRDSEDRSIATTAIPYAMLDEFAYLRVIDVTDVGAFLDWGLEKDLFVPFREQHTKMERGKSYIVRIYFDNKSMRLAASSKLDKFFYSTPAELRVNQQVKLLITFKTELGYKTIIDNKYQGMLFNDDIFQSIKIGQSLTGFIKKLRSDGKVDVAIHPSGYGKISELSEKILKILKDNKGYIAVTDQSKPELIYHLFGMSKKNFKTSIGNLYRNRLIRIEKRGIRIVNDKI